MNLAPSMKSPNSNRVSSISAFLTIGLLVLAGCGSEYSMNPAEKEIVGKIKSKVTNAGDEIEVSEILDSGWIKVCLNPIGAETNIESKFVDGEGIRSSGVVIRNNVDTYSDDTKFGFYFVYPDRSVEYFNISPKELLIEPVNNQLCADRDTAFLVAEKFPDGSPASSSDQQNQIQKIYVKLISK